MSGHTKFTKCHIRSKILQHTNSALRSYYLSTLYIQNTNMTHPNMYNWRNISSNRTFSYSLSHQGVGRSKNPRGRVERWWG